jgi:hypothetical protein
MTARATDADVRTLVPMPAKDPTTLFLSMANMLVEEELVPATPALSASRLTTIEQLLAAHFCVLTQERGGLTSSALNNTKDTYYTIKAQSFGLGSTRFGMQAIQLDDTGTLAALLQKTGGTALFRVAGYPYDWNSPVLP